MRCSCSKETPVGPQAIEGSPISPSHHPSLLNRPHLLLSKAVNHALRTHHMEAISHTGLILRGKGVEVKG